MNMPHPRPAALALALLLASLVGSGHAAGMDHATMDHDACVMMRGDQAMGFDHARTTHHFLLTADGGTIAVGANDPADTLSRARIRMHLAHIATMFSSGDFDVPMFIHDRVPPGVPVMKKRRAGIRYDYAETPGGGEVRITTADRRARDAVHDFLRFQIRDHRTGDPLAVTAAR